MGNEVSSARGVAGANAPLSSKIKVLRNFEDKARKLVTKTLLSKSRKDQAVKEKMYGLHRDITTLCDSLYKENEKSLRYKAKIAKRESINGALARLGKFFSEEVKIGIGDAGSREGDKLISYKKDVLKQIEKLPESIDYVEDMELPSEPAMAGGKAQENPSGKISTVK